MKMKSLATACDVESPPKKKLKQTRLFFQANNTQARQKSPSPEKKRKCSLDSEVHSKKSANASSKENEPLCNTVVISDGEGNDLDIHNADVCPISQKKEDSKSEKEGTSDDTFCNDHNDQNTNGHSLKSHTEFEENFKKITCLKESLDCIMDVESSDQSDDQTKDTNLTDSPVTEPTSSSQAVSVDAALEDSHQVDKQDLITPNKNNRIDTTPKSSTDNQILTPKQLQKKLEAAKKKEEKEQERQEKDRKKQEEKDEKTRQRQEKEEQKRKEREEKEKLKRMEKEEKERHKEKERKEREEKEEAKKKEKEAKEEDRRKKQEAVEEERRKKELEKEDVENRKKKAAEAFTNFFLSKQRIDESKESARSTHGYLSSFAVKTDMRVAPLIRRKFDKANEKSLERVMVKQTAERENLYLSLLKCGDAQPLSSHATWPTDELKDVIIIDADEELPLIEGADIVLEESKRERLRPKLLSFCENRRPPYWGTWRKKNSKITGRRPLGKDESVFDYDCDSDDEWEEEEPGESVGGSVAGSEDENEADEYEVDNEFFVPHGYLSDEEAVGEDEMISLSPETQKAKLKYLEDEFENELKKPTERLKPRLFGVIWESVDCGKPSNLAETIWNYFDKMEMLTFEAPINLKPLVDGKDIEEECETALEKSVSKKPRSITLELIPDLIRLLHGNTNNRVFLVKEFQAYVSKTENPDLCLNMIHSDENQLPESQKVSKLSIKRKVKEISKWMICPDEGLLFGKYCWYVAKETRDKYAVSDLTLPNTWPYILEPTSRNDNIKKRTPKTSEEKKIKTKTRTPSTKSGQKVKKKIIHGLDIKKFARKLSYNETPSVPSPSATEDHKMAVDQSSTNVATVSDVITDCNAESLVIVIDD